MPHSTGRLLIWQVLLWTRHRRRFESVFRERIACRLHPATYPPVILQSQRGIDVDNWVRTVASAVASGNTASTSFVKSFCCFSGSAMSATCRGRRVNRSLHAGKRRAGPELANHAETNFTGFSLQTHTTTHQLQTCLTARLRAVEKMPLSSSAQRCERSSSARSSSSSARRRSLAHPPLGSLARTIPWRIR